MSSTVTLEDARSQLASLLERAADGEVIVIVANGRPMARLVSMGQRTPANALGVTWLAPDFDAPLAPEVLREFGMET